MEKPVSGHVSGHAELFARAAEHAALYRDGLAARLPGARLSADAIEALFDGPTPARPSDPLTVIDSLAAAADAGVTSPASPGFFGWVIGGSHPVGVAADMMTSAWGQNVASHACSPAGAVAEKVATRWLLDLLGLPTEASVGCVSGATMAAFTCLAAARSQLLEREGCDVERDGLFGAPRIRAFAGEGVHATIVSALRYLGLGSEICRIATDDQGRMDANALDAALAGHLGPAIVVANAGQINTGSFDRFPEIAAICRRRSAWLHIDGAFGLWARLLSGKDHLLAGVELADSWSTDGHKWLQLPYDSGFAIVRHRAAHARAMAIRASYLVPAEGEQLDPSQFVPELSRRARGFPLWAVLRALGREGIAAMIGRHCALAARLERHLAGEPGVHVLNDVVLNQLIIGFGGEQDPAGTSASTDAVIDALVLDGRFLALGADWRGRRVLRISIVSPATDEATIDDLAAAIVAAARQNIRR